MKSDTFRARLCRAAILALLMTLSTATGVRAESLRNGTALQWIPEDAAFFSSALRNREQIDRLLRSRAYQRLMSMPLVRQGVEELRSQIMDEDDGLGGFLADPQNQDLLELVKEAVSDEVFIYGGDGFRQLASLLMAFDRLASEIRLESITQGGGDVDEAALLGKALDQASVDLEDVDLPRTVIGFRLKETDRAKAQLVRIEQLIRAVDRDDVPMDKIYKKAMIDGNEWITLTFDGSMIPWGELSENAGRAELVERFKEVLTGKKAVVALGLHENYLMLQIGKSLEALQGFGNTSGKLIDHEKMAIVRKHEDKPLTALAYVDGELLRTVYQPAVQLDQSIDLTKAALTRAPFDEKLKESLSSDLDDMASDIKQLYPEVGSVAHLQYMTDDGVESFTQSWAKNLMVDASLPLDILSNVGGTPLAMFAIRSPFKNGENYDMLSKWFRRTREFGQQLAETQTDSAEEQLYKKVSDRLLPMLTQFDKVTRDDLIPAFGDGQSAYVVDGKLESRQWHLMMPPAAEPLPILELGRVCGITNSEGVKTAFAKYAEIADGALIYLKEVVEENRESLMEALDGPAQMLPMLIQSAAIPRPESRETEAGTIYEFLGLARFGLDPRIAPTAGISQNRFVFSLNPKMTERLLETQTLAADGPLADTRSKKLGTAARVDVAGVIGFARAWVNYGMTTAAELQENDEIAEMIPTVDGILEIMQCYRSIESAQYADGDSMISQLRVRLEDLPE